MSTLERCWLCYCAAVGLIALLAGGGGEPGYLPWTFLGVHAVVAAAQYAPVAMRRRAATAAEIRRVRCLIALLALPTVFQALAWLLPYVHPAPWEMAWYRADVALFGHEVTARLRAALPEWAVAGLQLTYAAFYFVPVAAVLAVGRCRGSAAFDRALTIVVGAFLLSYLGYLWFPTLAPKVVLPATDAAAAPLQGLRALIDRAELNPWDCFPSGHTMLSVTSAVLAWRWARPALPWLLLVAVPLVASTVLLRYHWPADVAAGLLLVWPVVWALDRLLDRDGMPPA